MIVVKQDSVVLFMEYIEGGDLGSFINKNGPLSERQARDILSSIIETLLYCHRNQTVHRDLKPENIMLVEKESLEKIKLIDFGIAGQRRLFNSE